MVGLRAAQPLVSVVTPVFNGARYLGECIDSVLAQTYENWEYVVVDNRSTDETADIAASYSKRDPRIRVVTNDRFLDVIQNWNHALRQMARESEYCKVVHADDLLAPDCLERMVAVAAAHPSVGIVSAYRLSGTEVDLDGVIPFGVEVVPGREICRGTLLGEGYVFGSPTSLLIRSNLIRERESFYNEENLHADTEVCFDVLRTTDLGFVHQVLTHTRRHGETVTATTADRLGTNITGWLRVMITYGPVYLTPDERARRLTWWLRRYGVLLAKAAVRGKYRDKRFRELHLRTLMLVRRSVSLSELGRGTVLGVRRMTSGVS